MNGCDQARERLVSPMKPECCKRCHTVGSLAFVFVYDTRYVVCCALSNGLLLLPDARTVPPSREARPDLKKTGPTRYEEPLGPSLRILRR